MDRVQQSMASPASGGQGNQMPTVEEIIALLMQGADPEELVKMGVPPELIMQAIQIIQQQMGQQQAAEPQPMGMGGEGLAGQLAAQR